LLNESEFHTDSGSTNRGVTNTPLLALTAPGTMTSSSLQSLVRRGEFCQPLLLLFYYQRNPFNSGPLLRLFVYQT